MTQDVLGLLAVDLVGDAQGVVQDVYDAFGVLASHDGLPQQDGGNDGPDAGHVERLNGVPAATEGSGNRPSEKTKTTRAATKGSADSPQAGSSRLGGGRRWQCSRSSTGSSRGDRQHF